MALSIMIAFSLSLLNLLVYEAQGLLPRWTLILLKPFSILLELVDLKKFHYWHADIGLLFYFCNSQSCFGMVASRKHAQIILTSGERGRGKRERGKGGKGREEHRHIEIPANKKTLA